MFEERKHLAELKKKVENSNVCYWLTGKNKRRVERFWQVVSLLQENSRMSLVEMSGKLKTPVSTLFDTLKEVEKIFHFTIALKDSERNVLLRNTIPVEFEYQVSIDTSEKNAHPNISIPNGDRT